jgi:hypothetical protein
MNLTTIVGRATKTGGIREKIENQYRFLRTVNPAPGSFQWEIAHEEMARLEALVARE